MGKVEDLIYKRRKSTKLCAASQICLINSILRPKMTNKVLLLFLAILSTTLCAQDNYHLEIEQMLVDDYDLENGEWVFFDSEIENTTIDYSYGDLDIIEIANGDFDRILNILSQSEGDYPYDSGWGMGNQNVIEENDVCLLVINLRKTNAINDFGKLSLVIQAEDNSAFEENITIQLEDNWNQYLIPFQSSRTYQAEELIVALSLAWEIQEIEVAGASMLNFKDNYSMNELPFVVHNERYGGYEEDAPWRSEAATRIENFRKSDLTVEVLGADNIPLPNADVSIRMLEHEFKWGTEIGLDRFAGNIRQDDEFETKLLNLDGNGHKFNWVTPGASLKWPGIEEGWVAPFEEKVNAINWLKENGYNIRFHTLVWPGWINAPFDIEENADNPQYIIDRTTAWIDFIVTHPELQSCFAEYDILNETTTNRDFEMALAGFGPYITGREFYSEVMNQLSNLDPDKPQVINDYITISSQQNKGAQYDFLKNTIQELIDANTNLAGIGFQAHIDYFPNSIYEVEEILNDFADEFGLPLKITEYDIGNSNFDDELAAKYLEDFLTMIFSIPEVDMFMFWGIWDGAHFEGKGNLFNEDWTAKPAADVTFNKIFNEWWTEEEATTDANGSTNFRPFKGSYEIQIDYNGEMITDTILLSDDRELLYCLNTSSATIEYNDAARINIFPNPSNQSMFIESDSVIERIEVYNELGQLLNTILVNQEKFVQISNADLPDGLYLIKTFSNNRYMTNKVEITR